MRATTHPAWTAALPSGWTVGVVAVAGLIALPVLVVAANLLTPAGEVWAHLAATVLPRYIANSLWLLVGVGAGAVSLGVGVAWLVTMCSFPGRRVFEWALLLPMAVPAYVIAYTYTGLLEFAGPVQGGLRALFGWERADYWFPEIRSLGGAIAMMILVLYPYSYLLSRAAFLEQSVGMLEVSRTLGRGPWRTFLSVALPLARPSIAAALALISMEALNDFGAVEYFAVDTFTTGIYRTWLGMGERSAATQLAAILMLFILALILLERLSRGQAAFHYTAGRYRPIRRYELSSLRGALATLACGLPVLLGFLVPSAVLLLWSIETAQLGTDDRFVSRAINSFTLASITAALAVAIACFIAYGLRLKRSSLMGWAARIASMGYAIPGSVIAVGILLPLAWLDHGIDAALRDLTGLSTGLLFSGTIVALIFAYLVRFLAISFNSIEAGLQRITRSMDDAARVLGSRPGRVFFKVHVPVLRGTLLSAGLLVFVDVMKELPATLIIRPFNFDTLAIHTYELARDEQLVAAGLPALAIVLVGIAPVILLSRAIARDRPGARVGDSLP